MLFNPSPSCCMTGWNCPSPEERTFEDQKKKYLKYHPSVYHLRKENVERSEKKKTKKKHSE